jgi:hypothetical protein
MRELLRRSCVQTTAERRFNAVWTPSQQPLLRRKTTGTLGILQRLKSQCMALPFRQQDSALPP